LIAAWTIVFVLCAGLGLSALPPGSLHLRAATPVKAGEVASSFEPPIRNELKEAVANAIQDHEIGLAGMCEKIYKVTAMYDSSPDAMYGTIAAGDERLPAIKTHLSSCV